MACWRSLRPALFGASTVWRYLLFDNFIGRKRNVDGGVLARVLSWLELVFWDEVWSWLGADEIVWRSRLLKFIAFCGLLRPGLFEPRLFGIADGCAWGLVKARFAVKRPQMKRRAARRALEAQL